MVVKDDLFSIFVDFNYSQMCKHEKETLKLNLKQKLVCELVLPHQGDGANAPNPPARTRSSVMELYASGCSSSELS